MKDWLGIPVVALGSRGGELDDGEEWDKMVLVIDITALRLSRILAPSTQQS
jgi:hypothetical protein